MAPDAIRAEPDAATTTELVSAAVANHCSNCHALLASDQRYCVNCGERRGRSGFPPAGGPAANTAPAAPRAAEERPPRRTARAAGATLVAGVATLLIALGVGVLIGHDSSTPTQRASAPVQVIRVGGGASTGSGSDAATTNASTGGHSKTHAKASKGGSHQIKTVVVHLTPKVTKAAAASASKVFGSSGNLSKKVDQKVGGSCSGGSGCQNGKFTGNFFSP